ncbi:hypothetical protein Syn7502_03117 [Synechococcus sp. PCC 7502]|uniref:thylakoid membrane photosystem I accumulation factor n=1 Tax=Synechococcus sp. PCC 7502 TaxID=1173263 RepID=UPI00029FED0F|nr:thylakoid membrane photosystem I accumulation factor [Synechococcus sp. PCC 7502]AFY75014.1 hypothetical protein Syn7502_03117 [Synechococcus sp. PCC 7502]
MKRIWLCLVLVVLVGILGFSSPTSASLRDDRYDGNIFALYGGNGSLIPPRVTLSQSLNELNRPALLVFYVDDSSDCKLYTPLLNQVQAFYGKTISIIPVIVDSLKLDQPTTDPTQEAFYYRGFVPQTVLISSDRQVMFDQEGKPDFEDLEIPIRKVLNLPPKVTTQQRDAKVRQINEVNP